MCYRKQRCKHPLQELECIIVLSVKKHDSVSEHLVLLSGAHYIYQYNFQDKKENQ